MSASWLGWRDNDHSIHVQVFKSSGKKKKITGSLLGIPLGNWGSSEEYIQLLASWNLQSSREADMSIRTVQLSKSVQKASWSKKDVSVKVWKA